MCVCVCVCVCVCMCVCKIVNNKQLLMDAEIVQNYFVVQLLQTEFITLNIPL